MRKFVTALGLVGLLVPGLAGAANICEKVGTFGGQFLKIGVGARAAAMGGAFVAVADEHVVEELAENLVADRLLGVEVVVEAPGEDAGGVRDLADRGGPETLLGEQVGGQPDQMGAALRRRRGLLRGRHLPIMVAAGLD